MYAADSYKEPFWAENKSFMTGRDPLGVQNSSVALYSRLLPGMTNLTLRLRYYGFYMWLLSQYDSLQKRDKEQSLTYHYNFIRRAELAIAYLMANKYPDEKSIVGSDYANRHIDSLESLGYYDLAMGADKLTDTEKYSVYWDYRSGALGQYFAGSLVNLKLIDNSNRFFTLLDKGRKLAEAYAQSISERSSTIFLEVIRSGQMKPNQLEALGDFAIDRIVPGSTEWLCYKELMISDDGITNSKGEMQCQRKGSVIQYLTHIDSPKMPGKGLSFEQEQYLINIENPLTGASFGWYYYRVNELFHYALETIFWGLLVELDGRVVDIREFIESMTNTVFNHSLENFLTGTDLTIREIFETGFADDLSENQVQLEDLVKDYSNYEAMALAFKQILAIYSENKPNMEVLLAYEQEHYLIDKQGRVSDTVQTFIQSCMDVSYERFIYMSIKRLINDHIATAYRKMKNSETNLLKFVIEDNFVTHVQTMWPRFTSPRLKTLDNFLTDLSLKEGDHLSEVGTEFLLELTD